ncbi:MAG: AI-2E family transporter, partial [Verrucomicrobiota bacterium]|nr:AI-2E family transporter [Verrucomicrobiota bacterium]
MSPDPVEAVVQKVEEVPEDKKPEVRMRLSKMLAGPFDIRSFALTGLFILAIFYTMYFMRSVLLPIVLAILLSYLFKPLLRTLGKWGIRPALAAAILLLGVVAAIAYAVSFLAAPAAGWLEKAPYGVAQLQHKLLPLKKPMQQVAKASSEIDKLAAAGPAGTPAPVVAVKQEPLTGSLFTRTPEVLFSTVLLLILLYFLLAYDEVFLSKLIKMMPRLEDKKRAVAIAHEIESHISRYLLTVTLINVGLGLAVGLTVGFLGLSNPIMWGTMVALLNFVPYLGALTGILCMTVGAILSYSSLGFAMLFPASYLFLATVEGNFITPYIMGRSLT